MEESKNIKSSNYNLVAYEDEIDLRELLLVIWRGKLWIAGVTLVAAVISLVAAFWSPDIYRSEALLAADEEGAAGFNGLASQYGDLASLAGISIPSSGSGEKAIGIETLKSRQFITTFIEHRKILPELMAAQSYDLSSNKIVYNEKMYDSENRIWTRKIEAPYEPKPSPQQAYEEFAKIFAVSEDSETGFVTVSVEHISPVLAERWVKWLVEDINNKMMSQATLEARESIAFLTEQLENTQIVALQEVFYSLIEEQTKIIMLANARPEYFLKTIDPAIIPEKPVSPNRVLICIIGFLIGGMLGLLFVLFKHYLVFEGSPN